MARPSRATSWSPLPSSPASIHTSGSAGSTRSPPIPRSTVAFWSRCLTWSTTRAAWTNRSRRSSSHWPRGSTFPTTWSCSLTPPIREMRAAPPATASATCSRPTRRSPACSSVAITSSRATWAWPTPTWRASMVAASTTGGRRPAARSARPSRSAPRPATLRSISATSPGTRSATWTRTTWARPSTA